jgi:ribosomal protein S18 acetylase RimI-like enzyme
MSKSLPNALSFSRSVSPDIPAIIQLVKASWARTYDPVIGVEARKAISDKKHVLTLFLSEIERDDAMGLVAKAEDNVIGYVGGEMRGPDVFFIDHLHVAPQWHGKQIATGLLLELRSELENKLSPKCIELTVLENNHRAVAFYKKTGFIQANGANEDQGLGGVPSILMRWNIS